MSPRSWDVGRRGAVAAAAAVVLAACGQARVAAPPQPEYVVGRRAEPTVVVPESSEASGGDRIEADDVEDLGGAPDDTGVIDVGRMTTVDDAGDVAPNGSRWEVFDQAIERRLIPADLAVSVAVMVDGDLVHAAAFGSRAPGRADPAEPTDRFRVASISKTITAIVTMQLVEEGVLTLDDPVGDVLVAHLGLANADPDVAGITVRELLSHTAGFPKHHATFFSNGATSCVDAATRGLSSNVSGGSGFNYSNMGYCVLMVLIEAVTGKTYERVVYEHLLTPLGISGMRMTSTYDLGPDEVSHFPSPNRNFMETLGAAGAWNATPSDLVRILNAIDPATPGWKALSDDAMRAMRYRVPTLQPPSGYGLGIINYDGDAWGHTGTIQNTHAMVLVQPDGVTFAITVSGRTPSSTGQLRSIVSSALADAFPG